MDKPFLQHVEEVLAQAGFWLESTYGEGKYAGETACQVRYGGRDQYVSMAAVRVLAPKVYLDKHRLSHAAGLERAVDAVFDALNADSLCEVETVDGQRQGQEHYAEMIVTRKMRPDELFSKELEEMDDA